MKSMKALYFTIILFLYFFSFKLPFIKNSIFLALLISLPFFNGRTLSSLFSFFKSRISAVSFIGLSIAIFYYAVSTIISGYYDYSLLITYAGILVYGVIGVFISSVIYNYGSNIKISDLIFYCLAIQALIILMSFIFPSFKSMMDYFRTEESIDVASRYFGGGVRGLALSGSQFFGLAALLALMIYYSCIIEYQERKRILFYLSMLLFSIIFLSVGRTVIIGVIFFFIFFVFNIREGFYKFIKVLLFLLLMMFVGFYAAPFINQSISDKIDGFITFAFEAVINFVHTGEIKTSSTDVLSNMYYPLSIDTLTHGDSQYVNADGTYYGYTDAGYMRNILSLGLPFTIIFNFSFIGLIFMVKGSLHDNFKFSGILIFIAMLCVLHYKGEVFWTLLSIAGFVSFISSYSYFISRLR